MVLRDRYYANFDWRYPENWACGFVTPAADRECLQFCKSSFMGYISYNGPRMKQGRLPSRFEQANKQVASLYISLWYWCLDQVWHPTIRSNLNVCNSTNHKARSHWLLKSENDVCLPCFAHYPTPSSCSCSYCCICQARFILGTFRGHDNIFGLWWEERIPDTSIDQ